MITTNAIYHCEELEDNVSVYDTIVEENEYADLKEEQPADGVYLDLVSDETEKYDQDTKPPELPKPRPETTSQDEDRGYEGLEGKSLTISTSSWLAMKLKEATDARKPRT